jgi:hypothetical protein
VTALTAVATCFVAHLFAIVSSLFVDPNRVGEQEAVRVRHDEVVRLLRVLEARLETIERAT